jgi:AraC-like DNA-binding protein
VRATPNWNRRLALVDEFLLRRLDDGRRRVPEMAWAWRRLVDTGGAIPIGQIAKDVGWSHRHLIAKFRQQIGLAPKMAARAQTRRQRGGHR